MFHEGLGSFYCEQIVSYVADKAGYRPHIQYIGKGVHPPPPPTYANVKIPHQYVEPLVAAAPVLQGPPVLAAQVPVTIPHGPEYGHHYGGDYGYDTVLSPSRISKKRALLYDRTLFRRDIPKPPTPPRK
ncbi:unnamed protein product [Allacma fusca]|uniref:Uncharacterized protein n=1 Tax=Allacma fusca TaxID=39272 RepID=A0A8J2JKE9_9HEXA|nr:unnamed protein product [Allacma fusca]